MHRLASAVLSLFIPVAALSLIGCAGQDDATGQAPPGKTTIDGDAPDRAEVPEACGELLAEPSACPPDVELEKTLEREYWKVVGHNNVDGVQAWVDKAKRYVDGSGTPRAGRLATMITAGLIMVYRSYDLVDPIGAPELLEAMWWAEKAHAFAPDSPNTGCFYQFITAYRQFGLLEWDSAMASLDTLFKYPSEYGERGSEGEVVGALALGLLTDADQAKRTLEILKDCTTFNCQRTSSLAPYKVVGMHMAIAESYAKVGDLQGMDASLGRARAQAEQLHFPYMERIDALRDELTRPDGLRDQWAAGWQRIGYVRLPLPPSARVEACSTCHAGAQIPPGIYP